MQEKAKKNAGGDKSGFRNRTNHNEFHSGLQPSEQDPECRSPTLAGWG